MKNNLIAGHVRFEGVKGVGTMDINFAPDKNAYVLIGENGIGKTKFLESLLSVLLVTNKQLVNRLPDIKKGSALNSILFSTARIGDNKISKDDIDYLEFVSGQWLNGVTGHTSPVIYLATSGRGNVSAIKNVKNLGSRDARYESYITYLLSCFNDNKLNQLNMDTNLNEWVIQRAQSANKYQAKEDNREIEITTLLTLLNQIDTRIDAKFLEISGDNQVFIQIEGQKRELSELSSGFTAILKMLQGIIAGYSYFTNEVQIQNVPGFVLIDEIESHLHNEWQVNIVPLLKKLFPNTTFVVSTHSSLVISQLEQGEAYRLARADDGIVYSEEIKQPNKLPFVDLMFNAFHVDLNQIKIDRAKDRDYEFLLSAPVPPIVVKLPTIPRQYSCRTPAFFRC